MSDQLRLNESNTGDYLRRLGVDLPPGEVRVEKCRGEGNINWVRRAVVSDGDGSLVVKQARPALEKFPQYEASTDRIVHEARYYEVVDPFDRDGICPRVLFFDADQRVLGLEDLGDPEPLHEALARGADVGDAVRALAAFLGRVHAGTRDPGLAARFENDEMRRLHGEHIFDLPYRPNDFPLPPEVRDRAREIWRDRDLVEVIDAAYERYLRPEGALVHGDVQAGNVLLLPDGPKLLDAEICHVGDPAFDVGILLAHLRLGAVARGEAGGSNDEEAAAWSVYAEAHGEEGLLAFADAARYAGIELLRRSIGAARAPAVEETAGALAAIDAGLELVREPPAAPPGVG